MKVRLPSCLYEVKQTGQPRQHVIGLLKLRGQSRGGLGFARDAGDPRQRKRRRVILGRTIEEASPAPQIAGPSDNRLARRQFCVGNG